MLEQQNSMTEAERLKLISDMIAHAKNSFHESGLGPILWGVVITVCSLVTFSEIHFQFKLPFDIWILTVLAIIPQVILVSREKKMRKARSRDELFMDAIWSTFGIAVFLLIFLHAHTFKHMWPAVKSLRESQPAAMAFSDLSTGYFLLLYGIPTLITGIGKACRPMVIGGVACWVLAVLSVYTPLKIDMLFSALAATLAWLIPGILLRITYLKNRSAHV